MSRILWFSLGAVCGAAYASRVIRAEKLDLAIGESRPVIEGKSVVETVKEQLRAYQDKLADLVQHRTNTASELINDRAEKVSDKVTEKGQAIAESIRSVTFLDEMPNPEQAAAPAATEPHLPIGVRANSLYGIGEQPL